MLSWISWKLVWGFISGISLKTWLIVGAVALWGWWSIHQYNAGWNAKALEVKIATLEKNAKVKEVADKEETLARQELDKENAELEKRVREYEKKLKNRPNKCPLGDDADELNRL
jgi:hypothetical protein